jgi:membrane protein DedA with SNARE-associated domain
MELLTILGLAAGTLISEDGTCVLAGIAAAKGHLSFTAAIAGCAAGIFVGDAALWTIGWLLGPRVLRSDWVTRRWPEPTIDSWAKRLNQHAATAILASRFLPGTRLPLYLAAGALGSPARTFFTWTFVAVAVWTPLLVLGSASLGPVMLLTILLVHWIGRIDIRRFRRRASVRLTRLARWEFWPGAILYAPVVPWIMWLAWRYHGLATMTAANPAMPEGGFVGESKFDILRQLPETWTIPAALIRVGDLECRVRAVDDAIRRRGWTFPIVLKPDAGQRGAGVRRVSDLDEARHYLSAQPHAVVAQPYHPGPFEAGIFYYRLPHDARGRIFSITDKKFPVVTGDGQSTIEELIWDHPRFRLQTDVFLVRHAAIRSRVLRAGERFPLAIAGNHAQGTMFVDGSHLWTRELEDRIDEIARSMPGFYIGRFDVRYGDIEQFRRGNDLAIVELNGVTSESTNIYDPAFTLLDAWQVLFRQWELIFRIGAANRARGAQPASISRLLRLSLAHVRARPVLPVAS